MTPQCVTWRTGSPPVRGMKGLQATRVAAAWQRRYFGASHRPARPLALIAQLFSFLSVGVLATLLQYLLTAGFVLAGWLPLVAASTVAFLVSAAFNYWANARLTFAKQGSHVTNRSQQLRFAAMVALGCALNAGLLRVALALGLHPVLSQLIATAGVLASNFMLSRLWVFRKP
jgi:putative flippase GtrA